MTLEPILPFEKKRDVARISEFKSSGCLLVFYSSIDREKDFLIGEYYGLDSFV